jgi:hypothetical protein
MLRSLPAFAKTNMKVLSRLDDGIIDGTRPP